MNQLLSQMQQRQQQRAAAIAALGAERQPEDAAGPSRPMTSVAVPVPSAPVVCTRTTEKRVSKSSGSFARARARKMEVEASVQRQMQEMWDMGVIEKGLERQLQAELKRLMLADEETKHLVRVFSPR
jgi:hypothetical protein